MVSFSGLCPDAVLAEERAAVSGGDRTWLERQCPTFTRTFLAHGDQMRVAAGHVVVAADALDCGVFGILAGSVAIRLRSKWGSENLLNIRHAGYWCGRCELVALTPPDLVIVARATTRVVHVPGAHVRRLVLEHPGASQAFADLAGEQSQWLTTMLEAAFERRPLARAARKLLVALDGDDGKPVRLTQDELAEMTHVSRGTINRVLAELEEDGAITTAYGRVAIADRARLRHAAGFADVIPTAPGGAADAQTPVV